MSNGCVLFINDQAEGDHRLEAVVGLLPENWQSRSAAGGSEALKALGEGSFDVVVCAGRLPDVSGPELLKTIGHQHPGTLKILVMDGDVDKSIIHQTWSYVHQYVGSDCTPANLAHLIGDSFKLHCALTDDHLRRRIAAIGALPSPPEMHTKMVRALLDENVSLAKIAELVGQDVGVAAKVLSTANSAYFGLRSRVDNLTQAINTLGMDTVESIVFAAGAFSQFNASPLAGYSLESIHDRGIAVGARARLVAHVFGMDSILTNNAMLAGTLHDIGKLVMLCCFKDEFRRSVEQAEQRSIPLHQAELEVMGVTDAMIGAYLLSVWGLQDAIVEAVAWHSTPSEVSSPVITPLTAVHLAYATDRDERKRIHDVKLSTIDAAYLDSLGITGQLPTIRNFCSGAVATPA
ncbi:MAG: response regulator [bacterium]